MHALLEGFITAGLAPLMMCATSVIYLRLSPAGSSRVAPSAHGFLGAIVYALAIFVYLFGKPDPWFRAPYLALWLVPLAFVGVSLWRFRGPVSTHLPLVPLLAAMLWALIVGYTVIGDGK